MKKWIACLLGLVGSCLVLNIADARQPRYGYLVGTPVANSHHLEKLSKKGNALHYKFQVNAGGTVYDCAVNFKGVEYQAVPYRAIKMRAYNYVNYGPIFSAAPGWHEITMNNDGGTASQGALDYFRHKGILNDIAGRDWDEIEAQTTTNSDVMKMPEIDALFQNVRKIYVFGVPYKNGDGVHLIHQNQADFDESYRKNNGVFQDGGIIFEYNDGTRKLLMRKFIEMDYTYTINNEVINTHYLGQSDFSYSTDPDGKGEFFAGYPAPFIKETMQLDEAESPSGQVFGPFYGEQIRITANKDIQDDCVGYHDVDVYLGSTPDVSDTNYEAFSRINGCYEEFVRSYSNARSLSNGESKHQYYIFVKPWDQNSSALIDIEYR